MLMLYMKICPMSMRRRGVIELRLKLGARHSRTCASESEPFYLVRFSGGETDNFNKR